MFENKEENNRVPKGRSTIDSHKRTHGSKRAMQEKLDVVKHHCPKCHHHKFFKTTPVEPVDCKGVFKCCTVLPGGDDDSKNL